MDRILERYERYCYAEKALQTTEPESQGDMLHEYGKLKKRIEALQKSQSHFMGEKLDILSLKELQHLEQQLDTALKNIRSKRSQLLLDSIAELQRKEKSLLEHNSYLEKKVVTQINESQSDRNVPQQTKWKKQQQKQAQENSSLPPFLAANHLPNLNLGTYTMSSGGEEAEEPSLPRMDGKGLPAWMLRPSSNSGKTFDGPTTH